MMYTTTPQCHKKQVEALQPLDLNNQQIQAYQPQTKSIEGIFSKGLLNQEAINNELKKLTEIELKINWEDLLYNLLEYLLYQMEPLHQKMLLMIKSI